MPYFKIMFFKFIVKILNFKNFWLSEEKNFESNMSRKKENKILIFLQT